MTPTDHFFRSLHRRVDRVLRVRKSLFRLTLTSFLVLLLALLTQNLAPSLHPISPLLVLFIGLAFALAPLGRSQINRIDAAALADRRFGLFEHLMTLAELLERPENDPIRRSWESLLTLPLLPPPPRRILAGPGRLQLILSAGLLVAAIVVSTQAPPLSPAQQLADRVARERKAAAEAALQALPGLSGHREREAIRTLARQLEDLSASAIEAAQAAERTATQLSARREQNATLKQRMRESIDRLAQNPPPSSEALVRSIQALQKSTASDRIRASLQAALEQAHSGKLEEAHRELARFGRHLLETDPVDISREILEAHLLAAAHRIRSHSRTTSHRPFQFPAGPASRPVRSPEIERPSSLAAGPGTGSGPASISPSSTVNPAPTTGSSFENVKLELDQRQRRGHLTLHESFVARRYIHLRASRKGR